MDMDFTLLKTAGRSAREIEATVVRALAPSDLELLSESRENPPTTLKRLSERHHALARALASGMGTGEAAVTCGYMAPRVSMLQNDPAFQELVAFYRRDLDAVYIGLHERLAAVSADALAEISERLETAPEDIGLGSLIEISKMGADRTGHGPQTQSLNLNVNVGVADRLKLARERVQQRRAISAG